MTKYLSVSVLKISSGFRAVGIQRGPVLVPLGDVCETREQAMAVAEATPRKHPAIGFKNISEGGVA